MAKAKPDRKGKAPSTKKRGAPKGGTQRTASKAARDKIKAEHASKFEAVPVFDPEIANIILLRLSNGETLSSICKTEGMPVSSTVRRWAMDLDHPFAAQYAHAREIGYHEMADEIRDIGDDGRNDWMLRHGEDDAGWRENGETVARARLRVETRKWLLSKALPKIYGDKLALTDNDGGKLVVTFAV